MQQYSWRKQFTFFSLYVAQSVPMSLISTLLPVLMRQQNFSLTTIGLLQFVKLPWILKLLWAPLIDKYSDSLVSYKRWIWGSELCYALCLLFVACLDLDLHFPLILSLIVLAFVCSATQDIATDALTSRSFGGDTIQANKLQAMGQFSGTIIGGGMLMAAYQYLGWSLLFTLLALAVIILLIPLHLYTQAPRPRVSNELTQQRIGWGLITSFFSRPYAIKQAFLLILYNAGLVGSMAMMKPYLVDCGYNLPDIAWLFSLYGASCGFFASFLAGNYLKKIVRSKALVIGSLLILLSSLVVALMSAYQITTLEAVMFVLGLLWLAYGVGSVMIYAVAMDFVREQSEGTDFTLQIVLLHLSSLVVAGLSGKLSSSIGYTLFFFLESGIALLSFVYVYFLHYARSNKQI